MKKLQIPIEDELMNAAKLFALQNNTTLKEIVTNAITTYITSNTSNTSNTSITSNTSKDNIFVIRKTHKIGKPLKDYTTYTKGRLQWSVLAECRAHFDEDGNPIPYRYTDWDGNLVDLDTDDIKEIEEITGKMVEIER